MHQFLYEFLSNRLCPDMTFEIKEFLRGNLVSKVKDIQQEYDEDNVLRKKNRWRKYSL